MKTLEEPRSKTQELTPKLGLYSTTALTIGTVVGSGIFVSSAGMARNSETGMQMLLVWAAAGFLTLIGALTQAELCSQLPKTGGLYVYLREAFGEGVGFFYGWANFMIAGSGALAAIAFIFASYLNEFIPLWHSSPEFQNYAFHIPFLGDLFPFADIGEKLVGVCLILFLTWINTRGVKLGAGLQSISTSTKILALLLIVVVSLSWSGGSLSHLTSPNSALQHQDWLKTLGLVVVALGSAFWAYDGWGNVAYIAGEVHRPARTIPLALIVGTGIIIAIYLLVNIAYLNVFSIEALGQVPGDRVASAVMNQIWGSRGAQAVALLILLSTFDTVNSGILANARVYFAMAREKLFLASAGNVHKQYETPSTSLWLQGAWSVVLLVSGSFDLITSMYVWVNWLFYLLMALAVFVFRRRHLPRSFSIWGYPYIPGLFVIFTSFYLVMTLLDDLRSFHAHESPCIKSLMGLALVLTGAPIYFFYRWRRAQT